MFVTEPSELNRTRAFLMSSTLQTHFPLVLRSDFYCEIPKSSLKLAQTQNSNLLKTRVLVGARNILNLQTQVLNDNKSLEFEVEIAKRWSVQQAKLLGEEIVF